LNADPDTDVLVVASPGWTPGLVGLVAGKLAERFQKPALAFAVDEAAGVARGSGRSIEGVDLGAGVRALARSGMLLTGGGHAMAAGASLAVDALGALPELLGGHIERVAAPPLRIDAAGAVHEARRFGAAAERAGPFGPGFEEPVFALGPTRLEAVEPFGTSHVRYVAAEPGGGRLVVKHFGGAGSPAAIKARASASAHAPVWLAVSVSAGAFGGVDAHLRDLGMAREP
jgi:single-stranded-DNA-specific exonuclease